MPPQRRLPIEYDCDACGAHNVDAIRLTRHRNQCKAVHTRARRAYEKSLKLDKKRLAAKARAKAEKLASVTAASHSMPNTTQTLTSRTAIGNSNCQASADLGEGSSRDPQALIHPAPEVDLGEGSFGIMHPNDHVSKIQRTFAHFSSLYGTRPKGYFKDMELEVQRRWMDGSSFWVRD
ncbi:hypothetical protein EV424DRAFT_1589549 [Suillus variegatus]|nr:hypothetical protein EV424DRAFT_1589549 [Suillus variegatus]